MSGRDVAAIRGRDFFRRTSYHLARSTLATSRKPDDETSRSTPQLVGPWLHQYAVVMEFLGYLAVLGYGGYWLDERYGWSPWGLLAGLLLGTAAGLYRLIRDAEKLNK